MKINRNKSQDYCKLLLLWIPTNSFQRDTRNFCTIEKFIHRVEEGLQELSVYKKKKSILLIEMQHGITSKKLRKKTL